MMSGLCWRAMFSPARPSPATSTENPSFVQIVAKQVNNISFIFNDKHRVSHRTWLIAQKMQTVASREDRDQEEWKRFGPLANDAQNKGN